MGPLSDPPDSCVGAGCSENTEHCHSDGGSTLGRGDVGVVCGKAMRRIRCQVGGARHKVGVATGGRHGFLSMRQKGEERDRTGDEDDSKKGDVGGDLLHARKGLIDKVGARPAGQRWGEEGDDGCIGKREVEQRVWRALAVDRSL